MHGIDGLAGTEAGGGNTGDFGCAKQVVVADDLGGGGLANREQILKRNHGAGIGADVVLLDVLRPRAKLFVGLHVHAIGTVVEVEVVNVG